MLLVWAAAAACSGSSGGGENSGGGAGIGAAAGTTAGGSGSAGASGAAAGTGGVGGSGTGGAGTGASAGTSAGGASGAASVICGAADGAYQGTARAIPGVIEAEDFDPAGYSDTSTGNEGGAYRTDVDVDIKTTSDGYSVGWMTAGEWLEYTVNVAAEGDYVLTLQAGAVDAGRTVQLSSCGTDLGAPIAIPQVTAWGELAVATSGSIHLSAGIQVIRLTVGASDYLDLDSLSFTPSPGGTGGSAGAAGSAGTGGGAGSAGSAGTGGSTGTPVFHVFLLLGQSNMEGYPKAQPADRGEDPRVKVLGYDECAATGRHTNQWDTAAPPLHSCWNDALGPGDYFAKTLIQSLPAQDTLGLVPCAIAGEKIETFMKVGGTKYDWIVQRAKLAQQAGGVIEGILFHQGESNNGDPSWPGKVNTLVTDLRTDLSLGNVPFVAGELLYSGACAGHNTLVNQLPSVITNAHVVSASGLVVDPTDTQWNLHFSRDSQVTFGTRYAQTMKAALGW